MPLPPLNALRAFEAAARHGGFIGAAEELNVTRGAISRHVKLLEARLGTQLFRRHANGIALTAAGAQLLPELTGAFDRIGAATARITADRNELRVLCPPATSIRWLIPRIDRFREAHPKVRLKLTTDYHEVGGFNPAEFDLGFSVEHWPGRLPNVVTEPLLPVYLTPACAPGYRVEGAPLTDPAQLSRAHLLHETPRHTDWRAWAATFPVPGLDLDEGDTFTVLELATRAAVMGQGVVMGDLLLCRDEFEAGTLVAPFPDMIVPPPYGGICLIGGREAWDKPNVRAFREWVAEVAAADPIHDLG
ncbi:LysR family transcriptional regulator [Rhodobacterales bacterium HKCCE2091]|nr:LysR family transcriptional regulator [Rhodobacterales bacterium HKCCE2091]